MAAYTLLGRLPPKDELKQALQNAIYSQGTDIDGNSDVGVLYRQLYGSDYLRYGKYLDDISVGGRKIGDHTMPYYYLLPEEKSKLHTDMLLSKGFKILFLDEEVQLYMDALRGKAFRDKTKRALVLN